jgi:hypothetical protein
MTQAIPVVINGRDYLTDAAFQIATAADGHTIPYIDVDTRPDAYRLAGLPERMLNVSYLRHQDGTPRLVFGYYPQPRPCFKDLPMPVRAIARLDYLLSPRTDTPKANAARSCPYQRAAVMNDILYKRALRVALNPEIAEHQPYIVDVSGDVDVFGDRSMPNVPGISALFPDHVPTGLGHGVQFVVGRDGRLEATVRPSQHGRPEFASYPYVVRVQARTGLFANTTFQEQQKILAADRLQPEQQVAVWDNLLCDRAALIQAPQLSFEEQIRRETELAYGEPATPRLLLPGRAHGRQRGGR